MGSSEVMACHKMKKINHEPSSCKSSKEKENFKKSCCETHNKESNNTESKCGGNCDNPACKCVHLILSLSFPAEFEIKRDILLNIDVVLPSSFSVLDTKSGFYSNWQPPKIS